VHKKQTNKDVSCCWCLAPSGAWVVDEAVGYDPNGTTDWIRIRIVRYRGLKLGLGLDDMQPRQGYQRRVLSLASPSLFLVLFTPLSSPVVQCRSRAWRHTRCVSSHLSTSCVPHSFSDLSLSCFFKIPRSVFAPVHPAPRTYTLGGQPILQMVAVWPESTGLYF